jgi:hypothetical protein
MLSWSSCASAHAHSDRCCSLRVLCFASSFHSLCALGLGDVAFLQRQAEYGVQSACVGCASAEGQVRVPTCELVVGRPQLH